MWRRTYLFLLLVRIYFAFSPSYLHPDENFQGPEVFAGRIFSYPSRLTWEFTSAHPIRSVFPLWPVYILPMNLLKWFYNEMSDGNPPPSLVYYALRGGMFTLSFVLEDWAIYELVSSPRHRVQTVVLVASSYVTWTYQTHTFSNSLETLLVAWGLVLIQRIVDDKERTGFLSCIGLSFVAVMGVFNRVTFPAFLVIPGLQLLPHFVQKPLSLLCIVIFGALFTLAAIITDTAFYRPSSTSILNALREPIMTPLNNLLYNTNTANLAHHGLHPHYQHFLVNLPQLLGPVYIMVMSSLFIGSVKHTDLNLKNWRATSAISGTMILSIFPHQETRFLIPGIPLLLSCIRLRKSRLFLATWIIFNSAFGFLMGIYHQGGVIPTQLEIPALVSTNIAEQTNLVHAGRGSTATVFWWKTYSPPLWLLGNNSSFPPNIITRDLMGIPGAEMIQELETSPDCQGQRDAVSDPQSQGSSKNKFAFLVAPRSATFLDQYTLDRSFASPVSTKLNLQEVWTYRRHVNLDDLDFGKDGILPTLKRVIGRRGLTVWAVKRLDCE